MEHLTELFNHYGYIVLFSALALELIGFPTPGETLMTYCGYLVSRGTLNWPISVAVATLGLIVGITISYYIGLRLGKTFFTKYGRYIHLGPDKLEKTSAWFDKYGNGLLITALFIPGVRHVAGYFAGVTRISFKRFAVNAYIGAFLWAGTFISLGRALGDNWDKFHDSIMEYLLIAGVIVTIALICLYTYKKYQTQIKMFIVYSLNRSIHVFHSLGKIRAVVTAIAAVFVGLSITMIGLIQNLLANEFSLFDEVVSYLVDVFFPERWILFMNLVKYLTAPEVTIVLGLLLFIWILVKGRNKMLETVFLIITIYGGELLQEGLGFIFHRIGPSGLSNTFPGEHTLMAVVVYGFASFLILRHVRRRRWLGTILAFLTAAICLFTGLSRILFNLEFPSDVVAGYVFGGVWLSLNVVLLEIYRVLPKTENMIKR